MTVTNKKSDFCFKKNFQQRRGPLLFGLFLNTENNKINKYREYILRQSQDLDI